MHARRSMCAALGARISYTVAVSVHESAARCGPAASGARVVARPGRARSVVPAVVPALMLALALSVAACGARPAPARAPDVAQARDPAPAEQQRPAQSSAAPQGERVYDLEALRIEVAGEDAEGEPELVSYDAQMLLDQGNDALARGRPDEAIARYEKLLQVFPGSRLAPAAIHNLGLAHEARGDYERAMAQYRRLAEDDALERDAVDARLRLAAVLAERARWAEARRTLDELLARDDLTHGDRIEGMARLGYVAIEQQDHATAERVLRDALDYHAKLTTRLDTLSFVAMCRYYLAQVPHRQFRAIPMRLPDAQLERDLATKAELVALAYERYVDALSIQDAYWATAAGYQMSQIYKELWDDIVSAPIPGQLSPEAAAYYAREVHERVRSMLEKAMDGHLRNLELAEAHGTRTEWSDASRVRADEIARILAREAAGEAVTVRDHAASAPAAAGQATNGEAPVPGRYVPARVEL